MVRFMFDVEFGLLTTVIATNDKFLYIEDIFLSLNFSIVFKWRCERQMDSDTNMALL